MKNPIFFLIISILALNCQKNDIEVTDLISEIKISADTLIANGSDIAEVEVYFNDKADLTKCVVNVKVDNGTIVENNTQALTKAAIKTVNNKFVSKFKVKSSTKLKNLSIQFEVAQYTTDRTIQVVESEPLTIKISADSFFVKTNFESEIRLIGVISGKNGANVTEGAKVRFEDVYLDNSPVNGYYRQENLKSNALSQVSAIYTPGTVLANQFIFIKGILLGDNGEAIAIDSIKIFLK